MSRLPPLTALPAFEATARLGSVTAAAAELGRTHSAVSKQIRHLGDDMGGDLFRKAGTGLVLTERGVMLQAELAPMLRRLAELRADFRRGTRRQRLRIAAGTTFATRWLTARLPRFYAAHPDVEISLLMSSLVDGKPRYPSQEFDLLLSFDRLRGPVGPGFEVVEVGDAAFGPVCAPDYPVVGKGERWSVETRFVSGGDPSVWAVWQRLAGVTLESEELREHAHQILALEAAAAGLGVALSEQRLTAQDLAQGRLVAPLGFTKVRGGFQVAQPSHRTAPSAAAPFIRWLREEAAE